MTTMTYILTALSIIGVILNAHGDRRCFYIWCFTNTSWAAVDFYKGIPAQGIMFLLNLVLAIYGLHKWRRRQLNENTLR